MAGPVIQKHDIKHVSDFNHSVIVITFMSAQSDPIKLWTLYIDEIQFSFNLVIGFKTLFGDVVNTVRIMHGLEERKEDNFALFLIIYKLNTSMYNF